MKETDGGMADLEPGAWSLKAQMTINWNQLLNQIPNSDDFWLKTDA
jgi:hypothetical protein